MGVWLSKATGVRLLCCSERDMLCGAFPANMCGLEGNLSCLEPADKVKALPIDDVGITDLERAVEDACLKQGYLLTRDALGSWRLRFFSLRSSGLYICTSHSDTKARGFIPLVHGPDRPPPQVSALPEQNDRSYHISFDCSWLLQAESDEDRARWLAGVAVIGVRQSNLKVEGPPDEVCCGSLTRYMMDGTGCNYWAVLFDDGWLHLYSSREQQAEQEAPKIRLNLRSKHGAATARILSNVTLPTLDGDVTAEPETITGCFSLLSGLECFMCAETPEEMDSWITAIADAITDATERAAVELAEATGQERAESVDSDSVDVFATAEFCGSLWSAEGRSALSCMSRRSCPGCL